MTEYEPLGFENCNEASDKKVIRSSLGTVECFPVDTASRFFTLENKAEDVCDLTISKQVTGNLGSREEEFSFDISFYDAAGKPLTGVAGLTTVFKDVATGQVDRSRTYTLETNTQSVALKDGKSVTFTRLPKGTQYTINEKAPQTTTPLSPKGSAMMSRPSMASLSP